MIPSQGNAAVAARSPLPPILWLAAFSALGMAAYAGTLSRLGFAETAVATVVVVGVSGLLSGIAGFAFSAICGAMLFQFRHDTVGVVEIMLICSLANQLMNVWLLRRALCFAALAPFLIGGLLGVPLGVWLLLHLPVHDFKIVLGALLVIYGGFMLCRRPMTLRRRIPGGDIWAGFVGGMIGGFAATPGAAAVIWCGMKDWDKLRQRAVVQPYIACMQIASLIAIPMLHGHGAVGTSIPPIAWACVPAGLLGTWWGLELFKRLTDRQFTRAVNLLLIMSGIGLVA